MTLLTSLALLVAGASFVDQTFDRAGEAYANRDFAGAVQLYEQLISEGVVAPEVFYNLGNAYYRMGRLGPAIANYERALHLDPNQENAAHNLAQCIGQTKRRMAAPAPPEWEQSLLFWHYGLAARTTSALAILFWVALWVLLGIRQWRPIVAVKYVAPVLALLALAFGASAWVKAHPQSLAVASRPDVPVYYGTSEEEKKRFELFEGDRVLVDRREGGWVRVTTADGERGWTREEGVTFVGPPYERPAAAPEPAAYGTGDQKSAAQPAATPRTPQETSG